MIFLRNVVERIDALVAEGTDASLTYAALEARLGLEKLVYDRLRQAHDYISHDQLMRWQPKDVMTTLIQQVDERAAQTLKLSISTLPASDAIKPEDHQYVEVGVQAGFDPKEVGKLWQALSNVALHVKLPRVRDEMIPDYGDRSKIEAKVADARTVLDRIAKGTMVTSGFGPEVSFQCGGCGETNKRRANLLESGQSVYCINPACQESYTYHPGENDEPLFKPEHIELACITCQRPVFAPQRKFLKMPANEIKPVICPGCGGENHVRWILAHVHAPPPPD